LLACEEPRSYEAWRGAFVTREIARRENEERSKAEAKGKAFKGLTKSERSKIEERLPRDVVAALLQDTAALRKGGWSQPPGTRWVAYFRQSKALVPRVVTAPARTGEPAPTTALLALSSDTLNADVFPPISDAVRRLDAIHDALVKGSDLGGGASPCFTGKLDGAVMFGHRHATLVPLSLGKRKDRLDHILVHCPMGLDPNAREALFRLRKAWAHNLPDLFLTLAGMGRLDAFAKVVPITACSRGFRSLTPFVPSRFLKSRGKDTLLLQVQRELALRDLCKAKTIEIEVATDQWVSAEDVQIGRCADDLVVIVDGAPKRPHPRFRHFLRSRAERRPPVPFALSLRLTFDSPVPGPLTLGYGSHFGLGAFEPLDGS
jgi:CRISPR-associated protein Csb2